MLIFFRIVLLLILVLNQLACTKKQPSLDEGRYRFRIHDYRRAFLHLKPIALRGQPDAAYAVGYMYYYGQGVVENRERACYWINKAAAAGQPEAVAALDILKQI